MPTNSVQTWFWVDHDRSLLNRYQILWSDYWAGILTNAIAVLITSTTSPIFELLRIPIWRLWKRTTARWNLLQPKEVKEALNFYEMTGRILTATAHELQRRLPGYSNVQLPTSPTRYRIAVEALGAGSMVAIALGLPVALLIASIISAGLATDTIALSEADTCGTYVYRPGSKNPSNVVEFEHRVEAESGLYADECYGTSSLIENCNKFYNQTISYSLDTGAECHFDGNVCHGMNDSIMFTTGLVSASVLGVNTANPLLFSRTMNCSPLVTGPKYVRIGISNLGEEQWEYWYGRSLAQYTWVNPVTESSWEIKGYSTGIHCSEPGAGDARFVPLPEFMAGYFPITLLFISSHAIFYPQFRDDPIFPARQKAQFPSQPRAPTLYLNNSTRAGVLGCVDQFKICRTVRGPCWDNGNVTAIFEDHIGEKATEEQNAALLLLLSLDFSTACGSTQFRGAEALEAQTKIAHMRSLPLAEKQWQVEAEKMFQTSLARMQLNVFNVVRGAASTFDGYEDILEEKYRGICKLVKIPTIGWRNISFVGVIGVIVAVIFMWVISRKFEDGAGRQHLLIVVLWESLLRDMCVGIGKGISKTLGWLVYGLKIGWQHAGCPLLRFLELVFLKPAWNVLMSCL